MHLKGREIARMAYLNLHLLFPKKTEKIKSNISAPLRQRLIKEEVEKVGPILKAQELAQKKSQNKNQVHGSTNIGHIGNNSGDRKTNNDLSSNMIWNISTSSTTSAVGDMLSADVVAAAVAEHIESEAEREKLMIISPVKIANLRARRMSCEDSAVASIQALIRGRKSRRQTMSMQVGGDYEAVDDGENRHTDKDGIVLRTGAVIANTPNSLSSYSDYKYLVPSPSLTSKAPFSKNYDENNDNMDSHKVFTTNDENSILGLLRVKTALMMNFLDEQLTLMEGIEKERNGKVPTDELTLSKSRHAYIKVVERVLSISSSEIDINKEFQVRMMKLLP